MKYFSLLVTLMAVPLSVIFVGCGKGSEEPVSPSFNPVLTVESITPRLSEWPVQVEGEGRINAWRYTIIGSQIGSAVLEEVLVEVGDRVTEGQVIAKFNEDMISADLLQAKSELEKAKANLEFANLQSDTGSRLLGSGALSKEQSLQYKVNKESAEASVRSAKARVELHYLRLSWANVKATADGVISSRSAIQGDVVAMGEELFRMIQGGRLEWQGKFTAEELSRISIGQPVDLHVEGNVNVNGEVRKISPVIETASLMGTVYVDVPLSKKILAGMYATGSIKLGSSAALNIPESAIVHRDGYEYVAKVSQQRRVNFVKVTSLRRKDGRVEIVGNLSKGEKIVASGADFLMEGDLVDLASKSESIASLSGEGS